MIDWNALPGRRSFSPPITAFATRVSDAAPSDLHETLFMPFAGRLAGTSGEKAIENARVALLAIETCRRVLPLMCIDVLERPDLAELCRGAKDRSDVRNICRQIREAALAAATLHVTSAFHTTKYLRRAGDAANYAIMGADEDFVPWLKDGLMSPRASGCSIHMAWSSLRKLLECTFDDRFPDETDFYEVEHEYASYAEKWVTEQVRRRISYRRLLRFRL